MRFLIAVFIFVGICSSGRAQSEVPEAYRELYQSLQTQLMAFDQKLNTLPKVFPRPIDFSGELLTANSHMQEGLLTTGNWNLTMFILDRFMGLGVETVRISIEYPVLYPTNSRYQEYLQFYRDLADEIRRRGLKLQVQANLLFNNPEWNSSCAHAAPSPVDYSTLTFKDLKFIKRLMTQVIIRELRPDYLTIANEPTTLAGITGRPEFLDPAKYREMINYVLLGLDRQTTLVGAGAGNWENLAYISELASKTTLNFIDFHVYPVNLGLLERLLTGIEIARTYRKRMIIGEMGLQKIADSELGNGGVGASPIYFARDAYSFWAPLDSFLLAELAKLSRIRGVELIAPFFTRHFFGYVDYSEENANLSAAELMCLDGLESSSAMLRGETSSYGELYKKLTTLFP